MPANDLVPEAGVAAWVGRMWRPLLAEVVATALLVLLGIAAMLPVCEKNTQGSGPCEKMPLTHPALAFGFIVLANVEAFGPVSGAHMNPSVTLAAVLYRQIPLLTGVAYVIAQIFGATIGFGVLWLLSDEAKSVGGTTAGTVTPLAAAGVEALLTGVLALVCCAVWSAHEEGKHDPTISIKFGITVAGLVYAGGEMSGASLNPARSLAPALVQGNFHSDHWAYWVGPLGGSALATLLYRFVLRPRLAPPTPVAESLPLTDKRDLP